MDNKKIDSTGEDHILDVEHLSMYLQQKTEGKSHSESGG